MAIRNSNNYKIAIVKESVLGKQVTNLSTATFFNDKMEWNYAPITVERAKKENSQGCGPPRLQKPSTGTISGTNTMKSF